MSAGFGIGTAVTIAYVERDGELPMTPFGFRLLGGGFSGWLNPQAP